MGQSASDSFDFNFELENDPDEYMVLKGARYSEYKSECKKLQTQEQSLAYDFSEICEYETDYFGYHFLGTPRRLNELSII
jgi:hypothetical protein